MRRLAAGLLLALVVGLAAAGLAAHRAWRLLTTPFQGFPGTEIYVEIPAGASGGAILDRLRDAGVLPESRIARLWLVQRLGDPPLQAGEYRFAGPSHPLAVIDLLRRGEVALHTATVVEGLTRFETADALAAAGIADRDALLAAFADPAGIADLDPAAADLEGYLFPDSYRFPRRVRAVEVAAAMVANFRRRLATGLGPAVDGGDLRRLVTLASLVEKEARRDEERPLVAAVYANRLRLGMPLGADPTVIYGLKLEGRWDGNLRRHHLEEEGAPYNSYRRVGLPPSPICSPGLASLVAAAEPAEVDFLYFVSRNDGSHVFSRTLAEHSRAVERWQRQYWRDRWRRERAAGGAERND